MHLFPGKVHPSTRNIHLAIGAASLAAAIAVATGAAGVAPASAAAVDPGYVLTNPAYTGLNPAGVVVRVGSTSPNAAMLSTSTAVVAAELHLAGLNVVWSGLQPDPGSGITVSEGTLDCGPGLLGNTWPRMMPGIGTRPAQSGAYVELCPAAVTAGGWVLAETLRHEMGHAVGLGHTLSTLGGRHQTMYPTLVPADYGYGPGDWNGFRAIAALTRASALV